MECRATGELPVAGGEDTREVASGAGAVAAEGAIANRALALTRTGGAAESTSNERPAGSAESVVVC